MDDTLLITIYQNHENLLSQVEGFLLAGADLNAITKYQESPLRVTSNNGRFEVIKLLLSQGADESQLGWTKLFNAIAYGDLENLEEVITSQADLEHRDFWDRTPLLFSILVGDIKKTALLIEAGAEIHAVGRCGRTPLTYATQKDNLEMLVWLMDHGFAAEQKDHYSSTALIEASECGATKCVKALIDRQANIVAENSCSEQAISVASNAVIVNLLVDAGADINKMDKEVRAQMLGYQTDKPPNTSPETYAKNNKRVFGTKNPERSYNPFWLAMVKSGGSAFQASSQFEPGRKHHNTEPVWSYDRFGKSISPLPDGRFIEIAGEHEDSYDPHFCIYNDVFVHDGKGNCEIYTYPREVFPPTDFHTASLVGEYIYVIGNLGYVEDRRPGYTQVFRLNLNDFSMKRLKTKGDMPGWINGHEAHYDGSSEITVKSGKVIFELDGNEEYEDNKHIHALDINNLTWKELS